MSRFHPSVLLPLIGLTVGILLYRDSHNSPVATSDPVSRAPVGPPTRRASPTPEQTAQNTGAVRITSTASPEAHSSDPVPGKSTRSVTIQVKGLKDQSSSLHVAVFDSAEGFPKPENSRETTRVPIDGDTAEFSLSLPDSATTSIAVFQDLNGDGRLTKNSFGLPIEPYGFSNNPRAPFGPPSFSQTAFEVSEKMPPLMEIRVR